MTRYLSEREIDEILNESSDSNLEDVNLERFLEESADDISDSETIHSDHDSESEFSEEEDSESAVQVDCESAFFMVKTATSGQKIHRRFLGHGITT